MAKEVDDKQLHHDLAIVWLNAQDLSDASPTEIVELYFKALRKIQTYPVERW